jgi:hypothetical protein
MKLRVSLFLILISTAYAQTGQEHWVASWTTAQPLIRNPGGGQRGFHNQTVRMIVHTSIGGKRLRVALSSPFGGTPVTVGNAHVAIRSQESEIVAAYPEPGRCCGKPVPAGRNGSAFST